MENCIFCKIADKQIPSSIVYEDDEMLCFKDINPAAPVHLLLIPKVHFDSLAHAQPEHEALLGKMMMRVPQIARQLGLTNGFKTQINTGKGGGQEVFHLHIHIMGNPV
jgi:protein hitA